MVRPFLFPLFILFNTFVVSAQSNDYAVSLIPDSLKQNANAVLREEMYDYTYISSERNILKHRKIITILNKNGDQHAVFQIPYDNFKTVTSVKGNIYDGEGNLIRKIKSSEIVDLSGSAGYPMFMDIRYKRFQIFLSTYPYTVEMEYEVSISGSYYFPLYLFFEGFNVSVEKAQFSVTVPTDYQLSYKEFHLNNICTITKQEGTKTYAWDSENVTAFDSEPFSDDAFKYMSAVYTGPSEFSLGGYPGKLDSWKDYAQWIGQLNAGKDILNESRANEIRNMLTGITDDREKVKKLYSYLQSRTRYFNISLGIGGLQPMDANQVDEVGYSDCKGLSNYMKALLRVAGINAYYTLVEAGSDFPQIVADFPAHQFNHVIVCVPLEKDTIWLECTNQNIPFGFLGDFTSDRHALLIKDEGGEIVRTPAYTMSENFQQTQARFTLDLDGNGEAIIERKFGGLQFDDLIAKLYLGTEEKKKWLYNYIGIPNFQITGHEIRGNTSDLPESDLHVNLDVLNYASASGKRLFLPLNLTNRSTYIPPKTKRRISDIKRFRPYIDSDTVVFQLPEGVDVEFLPENRDFKTQFGEYISRVERKDNQIIYFRQVKMFKGIFPKENYPDLIKFYYDMSVADKCQAILIKKEG